MMVDNKRGLAELTRDIELQFFRPEKYKTVVVMLGRYDILCNRNMELVLQRFLENIKTFSEKGIWFILTGPFPRAHDSRWLVQDCLSAGKTWERRLRTQKLVDLWM